MLSRGKMGTVHGVGDRRGAVCVVAGDMSEGRVYSVRRDNAHRVALDEK